jgi:hypothetical protein
MTGNAMWRTSSYSGGSGGDCVEVRDDTGRLLVRDTKDRTGPVLLFTPEAWQRFADRVKRSLAGGWPCRFPVNGSSSLASFPPGFRLEDSLGG